MSIKWKILIPLLFLATLGLGSAITLGMRSLAANENTTTVFADAMTVVQAAIAIDRQTNMANAELETLLAMSRLIDFEESWGKFQSSSQQIAADIETIGGLARGEDISVLIEELAGYHKAWHEKAAAFYGQSSGRTKPVLEALRRDQAGMGAAIVSLGGAAKSEAESLAQSYSAAVRNELRIVLGIAACAILLAIGIAYRGALQISNDVRSVTSDLQNISGSETTASHEKSSELMQIRKATDLLRASLEEKAQLEREQKIQEQTRAKAERQAAERVQDAERKSAEEALRQQKLEQERERKIAEVERQAAAEREAAAEKQKQVVDTIAKGLHRLAAGDLSTLIETRFEGSYEALREDFNHTVTKLSDLIGEIRGKGVNIETENRGIVSVVRDLSTRTERTASHVSDVASDLESISTVLSQTVQNVGSARASAAKVNGRAQESGQFVSKTVNAVEQIEKSSQDIERIVGVIDEIAFQTNLLALNAGVEAARAGEAGRGFAVVATEVRALSQRSGQAAKEIGELIARAREHVQEGSDLTNETGRLFEVLISEIAQANDAMKQIDEGARQQSESLQSISEKTNKIDSDIQRNAAMFEETKATTTTMQEELVQLTQSVSVFKTMAQKTDRNATSSKAA